MEEQALRENKMVDVLPKFYELVTQSNMIGKGKEYHHFVLHRFIQTTNEVEYSLVSIVFVKVVEINSFASNASNHPSTNCKLILLATVNSVIMLPKSENRMKVTCYRLLKSITRATRPSALR